MRINEVTNQLQTFTATVRVSVSGSSMVLRTQVQSDGITQARALLFHLYGNGNVLSVNLAHTAKNLKLRFSNIPPL
jgi:hypothetical protein